MGSGSQGRSPEPRKSSINTFNWIQLYSAFSLQDAARLHRGKGRTAWSRAFLRAGGEMATAPQAERRLPRPEALWQQRLQAGRWAVTQGSRNLSLESTGVPTCRATAPSATRVPMGHCFSTNPQSTGQPWVPCAQGQDQAPGHEAQSRPYHPASLSPLSSGQSREPLVL